jgi:hypothetical protein
MISVCYASANITFLAIDVLHRTNKQPGLTPYELFRSKPLTVGALSRGDREFFVYREGSSLRWSTTQRFSPWWPTHPCPVIICKVVGRCVLQRRNNRPWVWSPSVWRSPHEGRDYALSLPRQDYWHHRHVVASLATCTCSHDRINLHEQREQGAFPFILLFFLSYH